MHYLKLNSPVTCPVPETEASDVVAEAVDAAAAAAADTADCPAAARGFLLAQIQCQPLPTRSAHSCIFFAASVWR
jgi:hypothetical protein